MRRSTRVRTSALVCAALVVVACVGARGAPAAERRSVIASFYPLAWVAQQVGGALVDVSNLTPAGAEPHDLELSPAQMDDLLDADLAIVMGRGFQPAVEKAAARRDGSTVRVLDTMPRRVIETGDPHVWLDPVLLRDVVDSVRHALTRIDPANRGTYTANADDLVAQLEALDARYRTGLADCRRTVIVTAHEAFGHLARRYGLRQEGVAGLDPAAEPDAKRIAELSDLVRRDGVTVVFTETLVSPRVADTLAREAGVTTETLNPLEGITGAARRRGATYLTVMDDNLRKLRTALECS